MGPSPFGQNGGSSGPSSLLDGPPPHPQMSGVVSSAMGGGMPGMSAAPARQLPQDMILGLMQAGSTIGDMLDTMAQQAPDIAAELAGSKELLQRGLAKLMTAGGGLSVPGPMSGPVPGATPVSRVG